MHLKLRLRRWGNSLAARLPRNLGEHGRLEEGMTLEVEVKPPAPKRAWKPPVVHTGVADMAERHDEYIWGDV